MRSFWMRLLVVWVSVTLTDAECHCNTTTACAVFPSTPCSLVGSPDRCQEGWFGSYCQKQNIALERSCNQSSTYPDLEGSAEQAVDGRATTNFNSMPKTCTHTNAGDQNPKWNVRLNTSITVKIQHIRLYLRDDPDLQDRNNGMEVLVGSQMCYNWSSTEHPPPIPNVTCHQPLTGTNVTIRIPASSKFLTLCEVQIFVCSDGWFSDDCDKQCRCLSSTDICDKITGHCSSGCFPGFNGSDCQTACPDGFHGSNCSSQCGNCLDDDSCDKTNGTCPRGCAAGWMNDTTCLQACPDGFHGSNCSSQCGNCLDDDSCDKTNGTCPRGCAAGWMNDTTCLQACPDGFHGSNCSSQCGNCLDDDSCDKTNGTCPRGCAAGWMNDTTCLQACPDGFHGSNCSSQCGNCLDDDSCDKTNGTCPRGCAAGWMNDTTCLQACPDGFHGSNCSSQCGNCLDDDSCDKTNGTCPRGCAAGWMNDTTCLQACPGGTYGSNCSSKCGNCLDGDVCDRTTGTCPGGCAAGWMNGTCLQACQDGSYGSDCAYQCGNCFNNDICDKTNGTCATGCAAGWQSDATCLQACPSGSYGSNCASQCGNCLAGDICDKTHGTCPTGCAAGWMSDTTCLQACPNGSHGSNCVSRCGNCLNGVMCDKTNGTCPGGCAAGWMNDDKMFCLQPLGDGGSVAGIVGGTVAAVVVIAVIVTIAICRKRRKRKDDDSRLPVPLEVLPKAASKDKQSASNSTPKPPAMEEDEDAMFSVEAEVDGDNDAAATYYNWVPPHMRLDNLKQCISEKKKKASFETEFKTIPYGARYPHDTGKTTENKPKNRFLALYAYDESRVVLADGEDYINANYIMGYDDTPKYIATQGPKPGTVTDFWRMVWQEDVTQIVMLTRLMEMNKKKCELYWPGRAKTEIYGACKVTNKTVTARSDYTVSTFLVQNSGIERTVTHYHFTSWPDHGVPSAPALVNFWRLVKQGDMDRGPMVVHCSAGVGRTGAFLALDYLMDEAESNHRVNVFMCVSKMRQNRMNMVQTVSQYEFVHDVVLEALNSRGTHYTLLSEFDKTFGIGETFTTPQEDNLKEQFELLQEQTSDLEEDINPQALLPENSGKNRNRHVLPGNKSRPYLCTPVQGRNDYINAVFLPSILRPSTMIVTQTPLPDTVVDFWRLVYDHDCFTVVCLDDSQETDELYPKDNNVLQSGPFSVIHVETNSNGAFHTETQLTLVHDKEDSELSVTVFRLRSQDMMSSTESLLELINVVDTIISPDDHKILIHCHDGAAVSGVFCSVLNIISRLRLDRDVDIFLTIRELQRVRPQFIRCFDQYKLCYNMVKEYNRASNIYANL